MSCQNDRLVFEIKQGESRNFSFTINQGDYPLNLNNCTVDFEVRKSPYLTVEPFIKKHITLDNSNPDGYILDANKGTFLVTIGQDDFKDYPPEDYYLGIYINEGLTRYSISGTGNGSSIVRFCKC